MHKRVILFGILVFLSPPLLCHAKKPPKGWHTGPYLLTCGGMLEYDWDVNQRSLIQEGENLEPIVGFIFGWNLYDWFSAELQSRYSTSSNQGRREHVADIHIGTDFFLLWDPLLHENGFSLLPLLKTYFSVGLASLPGDPQATSNRVPVFSLGPGVGGGIRVQWKKYVYFGIEAQEDFLSTPSKFQEIVVNGVSLGDQKIYDGGFKDQFSLMGVLGVHY